MTITEFLDYLDSEDWHLDADGNLTDDDNRCPLWHVYERYFDNYDNSDDDGAQNYVEAGRRCGLRTRDAIAIARAADNRGHPRLRKRLLAIFGLDAPSAATGPAGEGVRE